MICSRCRVVSEKKSRCVWPLVIPWIRAAVFVVSPIAVYSRRRSEPTFPETTIPVFRPMPILKPSLASCSRGELLRGKDKKSGKSVLVWKLPAGIVPADEQLKAFKDESAKLAKLGLRHILNLERVTVSGGECFAVYEDAPGAPATAKFKPGQTLDRMRATVITSATLTVDESFEYVRARLGIRTASEVRVPSEFDFERQAILYLPPRMPDPRDDNFAVAAAREVTEILRRSQGRAFVLFTSYATLRAVHALVEMAVDYPVFIQGSAPRSQLRRTDWRRRAPRCRMPCRALRWSAR